MGKGTIRRVQNAWIFAAGIVRSDFRKEVKKKLGLAAFCTILLISGFGSSPIRIVGILVLVVLAVVAASAFRAFEETIDYLYKVPGRKPKVLVPSAQLSVRWATPDDRADLDESIDDEVVQAMGWRPIDRERFLRLPEMLRMVLGQCYWIFRDVTTGEMVGCTSLLKRRDLERTADVGLWLHPKHRGRGQAAEVLRIVKLNAPTVGVDHMLLATSVDNIAMQRSSLRAGARELERYDHDLPNGTVMQAIRYTWDPPPAPPEREEAPEAS